MAFQMSSLTNQVSAENSLVESEGFSELFLELAPGEEYLTSSDSPLDLSLFVLSGGVSVKAKTLSRLGETLFFGSLHEQEYKRLHSIIDIHIKCNSNLFARVILTRASSTQNPRANQHPPGAIDISVSQSAITLSPQNDKSLEVLRSTEEDSLLGQRDFNFLLKRVTDTPNGKIRICTHADDNSSLHEMFMSFDRRVNYPPMSHSDKDETFLLLRGEVCYAEIASDGEITQMFFLRGCFESRDWTTAYCKIPARTTHYLEIISNEILAKETTTGPFLPQMTQISAANTKVLSTTILETYKKRLEK